MFQSHSRCSLFMFKKERENSQKLFCCIEIGNASDGTGTNRAEVFHLIDFHSAFLSRAIASFALIASPLKYSYYLCCLVEGIHRFCVVRVYLTIVGYLRIEWGGDWLLLRHQVSPL